MFIGYWGMFMLGCVTGLRVGSALIITCAMLYTNRRKRGNKNE